MHAADALMSPEVAIGAGALAVTLIAIASGKVKREERPDIIPLMGVLGAFVFAAQMINFSIPGTGSSGHLIGGILLSAILGPWAAFIVLSSIIMVQCLFFADGGLMALGCNILNMVAASCLISYPMVFHPIVRKSLSPARIMVGSILASVVALEIGALAVTIETELSGVTALPFSIFAAFMLPIHVVIGCIEGIVTGLLLLFVAKYSPSTMNQTDEIETRKTSRAFYWILGVVTLILAGGFTVLASEYPDGLEWSIEKVSGMTELVSAESPTVIMSDYDSNFAGIVGAVVVMVVLWVASSLLFKGIRRSKNLKEEA